MVFGEYIPFYEQMQWLHELIPETSNFARGTDVAVLPLGRPQGTRQHRADDLLRGHLPRRSDGA